MATEVRVAAAADLTAAFEEMGQAFEQRARGKAVFTFGSTGLLTQQIRRGAPFDVFAAANVSFIDDVVAAGACDAATKAAYARGLIALLSRRNSAMAPLKSLADLADARFSRIAIANPDHAPYGRAAQEALTSAGVWDRVRARLVLGENVRQTMQLAETGNVEAAIVALSLVVNDHTNAWTLIGERLHQPIDQALVVCGRGSNTTGGRAFAAFVNSLEGRSIMKRYGFLLPGEPLVGAP